MNLALRATSATMVGKKCERTLLFFRTAAGLHSLHRLFSHPERVLDTILVTKDAWARGLTFCPV